MNTLIPSYIHLFWFHSPIILLTQAKECLLNVYYTVLCTKDFWLVWSHCIVCAKGRQKLKHKLLKDIVKVLMLQIALIFPICLWGGKMIYR